MFGISETIDYICSTFIKREYTNPSFFDMKRELAEEIYNNLVQCFHEMTAEEKQQQWERLKKYNEVGPTVEEYMAMLSSDIPDDIIVNTAIPCTDYLMDNQYNLAA